MNLYLKVTVGLFLLVQTVHLASLQNSTDSPGRHIDSSWWRKLFKIKVTDENAAFPTEEEDRETEGTAMESSNDYSGIASGSMATFNEEEENVANKDKDAYDSDLWHVVTTALPVNVTTQQPMVQNSTDAPELASTDQTNSSNANTTEAEEGFYNSTTVPPTPQSAANATSLPDFSNHNDFNTTTLAPEVTATQESTNKSQDFTSSRNTTESVRTTTVTPSPQTTIPETTHTPTILSSTTPSDSWTTEFIPTTPTVAPTKSNDTDKAAASGSSSDRGLASDSSSRRHSSWGAVLGTAVAVICVGLVAYVILKHKHKKDFSHRKLVEEFPSDPVLRLDNNEPLDLNFGGSAYYNPALQGDNIQMTNFPRRP